ncbi:MAG: hypothetical protein O2894_05185 [Planctomycetota bacterium]|nr:hypothetical protein [Planctomycetota bacterium]
MSRRRSKRAKQQAEATAASAAVPLIAWRTRLTQLLDDLRGWSRLHYAAAIDAHLAARFGDPDAVEHAADVELAIDDFVCTPGSAGERASILAVWCDRIALGQKEAHGDAAPAVDDLSQLRRAERERRRGVFVLQRAARDRLTLWDPLEGAPLTLHLLTKLEDEAVEVLARGAIVTAVYQPWMAQLVAVGAEYFREARAIQLFREQVLDSGAMWHEPVAPAPERVRSTGTGARAST